MEYSQDKRIVAVVVVVVEVMYKGTLDDWDQYNRRFETIVVEENM